MIAAALRGRSPISDPITSVIPGAADYAPAEHRDQVGAVFGKLPSPLCTVGIHGCPIGKVCLPNSRLAPAVAV